MNVAEERRSLVVGLDLAPPPPMQLGPPGTPGFRGLEVDLLAAITTALGREPVYAVLPWSGLLDRLAAGGIDLVCTAATVTEERRRLYDFSLPYLSMSLVLAAHRDGPIAGASDIEAARVAVRAATPAEQWAARCLPDAELVRFETNTEAYASLGNCSVEALIDDSPIATHFVAASPELRIVESLPGTEAEYAIVFARGDTSLRGAVDDVLRSMARTGELDRIRRSWGVAS